MNNEQQKLTAEDRKSHTFRLAEDLHSEGVQVITVQDHQFQGGGEISITAQTPEEIYRIFTSSPDGSWSWWYQKDQHLGTVFVIPRNDVDLVSDYLSAKPKRIENLLKKMGWWDD